MTSTEGKTMTARGFRNSIRCVLFVAVFLLAPRPAEAWGPGLHFYLASYILESTALTAAISLLINENTTSFLYGNVVADIVVGKNMMDLEDHSHHWDVARSLRENASGAEEEAFAVGFWTHLAADTVAHNIFVPRQQEKGFSSDRIGHAYWELQAERWVPDEYRKEVSELVNGSFDKQRDLLQRSIPQTVLPFRLNWLIMDGMLQLAGRQAPQNFAAFVDRYASSSLRDSDMEDYVELSKSRMEESLDGYENRITRLNPIGKGSRFLS